MRIAVLPLVAGLIAFAAAAPVRAADCATLSSSKLANTTISVAQSVAAGSFSPPYGGPVANLPAFCRIAGVIRPTSDSNIHFEVWLPASGWNSKFLGVGNGAFAGSIGYEELGGNLRRGYATAGTDTGHEAQFGDASWAFGHPEKVIDFGYRSVHLTAENAKAIVQAFYGERAQHSYFDACSDGGREALMEAQRFPEDYDGILAGAPANLWTHLLAAGADTAKSLWGNPAAYISSVKAPAITRAALASCDAQDGVKNGFLNDPTACHFDPVVLLCKEGESRSCLTAPQVASLKKVYSGSKDFPGLMPGSEDAGWEAWVLGYGPGGGSFLLVENYFRYMVFQDPAWNVLTADIGTAEKMADEKTGQALNSVDPDLSRFRARGGKLILYHGWNDPAISPLNTVNYYQSVVKTMGAQQTESFARLYMVPGMGHCSEGPGPNSFGQGGHTTAKGPEYGVFTALEQWVEKGTAPDSVTATRYVFGDPAKRVSMTRPLCPYPQIASYKGAGDTNDAANFDCAPRP